MKKYIIIALALCVAGSVCAQGTVPSTVSATVAGSLFTDDHFSSVGGSLLIGGQAAVDFDRSLYGRVSYHRKNYGVQPEHYIDLSLIEYWYLGKKWSFYFTPIFSVGVSEGAGNPLSIGGGIERSIFVSKDQTYTKPFAVLGYADLSFAENQTQIMLGIRLTKPEK